MTKPLAPHGRTIHSGQSRRFEDVRVTSAFPPIATAERTSRDVSNVPNSEVAASFDQAPSTRDVGGIAGVSAHASRARTSRVHSGALNMPTLPRVGTAFLTRGINFFRPPTPYGIWDRSVKLSGFYRSGARHISATDLTQYLLADLIVNTGFSYASPGPLGSRLNRLAFPAWNSSLRGRR